MNMPCLRSVPANDIGTATSRVLNAGRCLPWVVRVDFGRSAGYLVAGHGPADKTDTLAYGACASLLRRVGLPRLHERREMPCRLLRRQAGTLRDFAELNRVEPRVAGATRDVYRCPLWVAGSNGRCNATAQPAKDSNSSVNLLRLQAGIFGTGNRPGFPPRSSPIRPGFLSGLSKACWRSAAARSR